MNGGKGLLWIAAAASVNSRICTDVLSRLRRIVLSAGTSVSISCRLKGMLHDAPWHTELDTICILQVTLSSYANSCLQTLRRNMTKLWAPQCPNKKSSFQRFGLQHSNGKCSQRQLSAGPRYHRMMDDVQPGTGTVATMSTA